MKAFDAALGAWPGLCGMGVKPLRFTKLFKQYSLKRYTNNLNQLTLPEIKYFNALDDVKWSGKFGQLAKMYPTRTNGYENDKATELFRQV